MLDICKIYLSLCRCYYANICLLFTVFTVMKKLLLGGMLVLAISCLLASCANDEVAEVPMNEKKEVTLTTRLDAVSRAVAQGQDLELFYTVYNAADGTVVEKNTAGLKAVSFDGNTSVTLTLQLEQGKSYDVAFWAQPQGLNCYDLSDMKAVKVCYDRCKGNDNLREAFYGSLFGLRAQGNDHVTVPLKSPFGKLEVLTMVDDVEVATKMGIPVDDMLSSINVSGVSGTFNALYGMAEGEAVTAVLQPGEIPTDIRQIEGVDYRVLTSDYLLPFRQKAVDVEVELSHTDIERSSLVFTAGRAWLNRGETKALASRYITHPIEFDVTVNEWLVTDASIGL